MRVNITKKMFISMTLLIVFIMVLQLLFQNFLLEDIYRYIKSYEVEKRFERAVDDYEDVLYGRYEDDLDEVFRHYELDSSASIIAIEDNFNIKSEHFFEAFNYILAIDNAGEEYKLLIDFLVDERGVFRDGVRALSLGESITTDIQRISGTDFYDVLSMKKDDQAYRLDAEVSLLNSVYQTKLKSNVELKITRINLVNRESGVISYQNVKLLNEVKNLYSHEAFASKDINGEDLDDGYSYIEEFSGQEIVVLIKSIKSPSGSNINVFSLFAVEKISSAFKVLNNYYIYFLLFQIILVFLLSYIYSRWITKPLINLIEVSEDISNLKFDNRYVYKSDDELGALSDSLTSISSNLSSTIENLKVSNDELAIEAIRKEENEDRMRNLLSSLSHEFKTPLGVISGFLEIINDKVYEKDPEYYMKVIEEEVEKLNLMVRDTLELSKLEMGEYTLKVSEVNMKTLMNASVSKFEYQIKEKSLLFKTKLEEASVKCDKVKIGQVLDNLISNAIKYTREEGLIELELKKEDDKVRLAVRNYGVTFSEEEIEQIWDRFYVREKSRSKDTDGTGLGLTIVKNILQLHNSDYGVSNIENGVEFYFYFNNF